MNRCGKCNAAISKDHEIQFGEVFFHTSCYPAKSYLGDGAYIKLGAFHGEIVITTEDGVSVQNTVTLGPREILELQRYLKEKELIG